MYRSLVRKCAAPLYSACDTSAGVQFGPLVSAVWLDRGQNNHQVLDSGGQACRLIWISTCKDQNCANEYLARESRQSQSSEPARGQECSSDSGSVLVPRAWRLDSVLHLSVCLLSVQSGFPQWSPFCQLITGWYFMLACSSPTLTKSSSFSGWALFYTSGQCWAYGCQ